MSYRRRVYSDTWHFHRACRWWPDDIAVDIDANAIERNTKPSGGNTEFCNECQSKRKRRVPE